MRTVAPVESSVSPVRGFTMSPPKEEGNVIRPANASRRRGSSGSNGSNGSGSSNNTGRTTQGTAKERSGSTGSPSATSAVATLPSYKPPTQRGRAGSTEAPPAEDKARGRSARKDAVPRRASSELPKRSSPRKIRCSTAKPPPSRPPPSDEELRGVQATIAEYTYNINGPTYNVTKDRPLAELFETAGEILSRPERPIQCVEAAFLGLHLTQGMDVVRFPISFHSKKFKPGYGPFPDSFSGNTSMVGSPVKGMLSRRKSSCDPTSPLTDTEEEKPEKTYEVINHLVIGLYKKGQFGAMGISRHQGLHSKPLVYSSLSDLMWEYAQHYKDDRHVLLSVRLGEAISHVSPPETYFPLWRKVEIRLTRWNLAEQRLHQFQEALTAAARPSMNSRILSPMLRPAMEGITSRQALPKGMEVGA